MDALQRTLIRVSYMSKVNTSLGEALVVGELAGGDEGLLVVSLKGTGASRIFCPVCSMAFSPKFMKCPNKHNHPAQEPAEPSV